MNVKSQIKEKLINDVKSALLKKSNTAIAFSGSLDSTLITYIALKCTDVRVSLYTIGYEDCYDFDIAPDSVKYLSSSFSQKRIKHKLVYLEKVNIDKELKDYKAITEDEDKVSISFTLPFFILLKHVKENTVLTGHGADTLFGGFYKYLKSKNLKEDIKQNYNVFLNDLKWREEKIAKHLNKELVLPFADEAYCDILSQIKKSQLIKSGERKLILRQIAKQFGLPNKVSNLPKKAFQYSSGIRKKL